MTEYVNLTDCERIVMKCVWDAGQDVSLVEIMQIVSEKYNRNWKRQTVSTFLLHLIQKGYLTSYRIGRVFYYHAQVPLQEYKKAETKEFLAFWYEGSVQDLVDTIRE